MVKSLPANAGDARDTGSIPGSEKYPGEGNDNPLQYPCLGNSMDRGAWQATVHRVTKSQTQLKQLSTHARTQNKLDKKQIFHDIISNLVSYLIYFEFICTKFIIKLIP